MKIALDAMGGDLAPQATLQGALDALEKSINKDLEIILLGNEKRINEFLGTNIPTALSIINCTDEVSMHDNGSKIVKTKPDSSMVRGIELVNEKKADGFISAGNTGAQMAASLLILGRVKHVKRPGLAVYFQSLNGGKILCDVGANPEVKPENLLQFAVMSSVYLEHVEGINNPKVGLINIGAEPSKGTELYKETHKLLSSELTNFIGNIEARNIFDCEANVLVCDGFVGNTIMKFAEGSFATFLEMIKEKIMTKNRYKIGAGMIKPALEEIRNQYDFEEHGGTPFLGVNGISISCHGASTAKAIMNSIFLTEKSIKENLINDISIGIDQHLGVIN